MAKTSLGKVAILPRGEYSSIENYKRLDIVTYNGSSYLCLQDCTGIDVTNTEYWQILAEKGDKGDTGAKGDKGEKGDTGKDFSIYKTYPSINDMNADVSNVPEGEFVLIASSVEDEDNAKLYVKNSTGFVYLTDLSGATGIKGEKGDKPINGVDYNTPEEKEKFKNEVVEDATTEVKQNIATAKEQAIQDFNTNASTKTTAYDTNANAKLTAYNDNATQKTTEYNTNATSKVNEFNTNASTKTTEFDTNATNKTNAFNENYDEKLADINEASTSIEQERIISDGKYARALKTPVTDVESTQIYAENDVVDDLVINGVELTQETREGYNKFNIDTIVENKYVDGRYQNVTYGELLGSSASNTSDYIEVKASKSYLLTYDYDTLMNAGNRGFVFYNTNKEVINQEKDTLYNPSNKSNIFTAPNQDGYLRFSYAINCTNIQLIEGTEEKPYEEYGASPSLDYPSEIQVAKEQNITINETNITIPLVNSAIGQYTDTIDRENNVQNKVIQELILTGSESDWSREDTSVGTRFFKPLKNSIIANANKAPYALCTHFKLANDGGTYNTIGNLFAIYDVSTMRRISFGSFTDISTVEEWKAKLKELYEAGTPVKVYYVAETPTKNSLQEEIQTALSDFKLYKDLNNIAIDGGSMSFIYNKSLLRALEEQSELSASLLERIQALEQAQVNSVGGN